VKQTTLTEFITNQSFYLDEAKAGKIFVYPTNTIYWIGWIVTEATITAINQAKQRQSGKHYSIIAPSFAWIQEHCLVDETIEQQWNTMRHQYHNITLLLPYQDHFDQATLLSSNTMIGVRHLGDHPIQKFVEKLNQPFITTSINISWQPPITHPDQILTTQEDAIDYSIDAGTITGAPSVLINSSDRSVIVRS
jgi:tRNA A37 threonylcarbamoyladenosine synthetase subunit TsaC/SUA5/YrdC